MKVTIATLSDFLLTIDVSPDMELENFKALCECEVGISVNEMVVTYEGRPLLDNKRDLKFYGVKEGDLLLLQQILPPAPRTVGGGGAAPDLGIDFSAIQVPGSSAGPSTSRPMSTDPDDPERLMNILRNNPAELSLLKQNNPALADAFLSGNAEKFKEVLRRQLQEKAERQRKRIQILNADLFDLEAQKLIAEEIRMDNVESNMEAAMEYHPESFGQVTMLYINCKVNGHPVKAFIDSGAQTTIMSQSCAERCGIMRLVDRRWAGLAKGVGVQEIIGRVHLGQIQINDTFLTSSFSILKDQPMDMLLGLDMLKRHQCCIDLKRNVLILGTDGTETPFLTEAEIPSDFVTHSQESKPNS